MRRQPAATARPTHRLGRAAEELRDVVRHTGHARGHGGIDGLVGAAGSRITPVVCARIAVVTCRRALTRISNAIVVAVALVGVGHRRTIVDDVGDFVPVRVLERVQEDVLPAPRSARTIEIRAADPLLALADTPVAELAG